MIHRLCVSQMMGDMHAGGPCVSIVVTQIFRSPPLPPSTCIGLLAVGVYIYTRLYLVRVLLSCASLARGKLSAAAAAELLATCETYCAVLCVGREEEEEEAPRATAAVDEANSCSAVRTCNP